ncbi:MAG: hypothetical protein RLW62_18420 [Gammaproteobacteria bacterium]
MPTPALPRRPAATLLTVALAALLAGMLAAPVHAASTAARGPAHTTGEAETATSTTGGSLDLNPDRTPVVSDVGFTSVTSVRVDGDSGVIGGYAGFDLDDDLLLPAGTAIGSAASGILSLDATVSGVGSEPATLALALAFDGSFLPVDGQPTLLLTGNLSLTVLPADPFDGTLYQSQLSFELSLADGDYAPQTIFTGVRSALFDEGGPLPWDGATHSVAALTNANLAGTVMLEVPVMPGDRIILSALLSGIAGPAPGDTPPADGLDVRASAGAVDFSHTGVLAVTLPAGFALTGDDPLIAGIVTTTPVPLPGTAWLLAACATLLARRRCRR